MDKRKWYVPRSVNFRDIKPIRRAPGGGVTSDMLHDTERGAYRQAIAYTDTHIREADAHMRNLEIRLSGLATEGTPDE